MIVNTCTSVPLKPLNIDRWKQGLYCFGYQSILLSFKNIFFIRNLTIHSV